MGFEIVFWGIHVISPYFGGSSLYFVYFSENLPTKIFRISYISYTSPYLEFQISLPNFKNSLLCLIILPIWKTKSPYLSSGMYHMYVLGSEKGRFYRGKKSSAWPKILTDSVDPDLLSIDRNMESRSTLFAFPCVL